MSTTAPPAASENPCAAAHQQCPGPGQLLRCALCPHSPTYWRLPQNRADGKPYAPLPPLDDPSSPITIPDAPGR